jgi:polysaccharide export outer membrane protein
MLPVVSEKQLPGDRYVLGPEDQITIRAVDADEISDKPIRIDASGYIRLPLAGRVKAMGLTTEQLENEIAERLQPYIKNPQVQITVTDPRSNPVSVLGAVKNPGVHQIQGPKTLAEALSLAGGLVDDAGYNIKITRRLEYGAIPLSNAKNDETGQFSVAEVSVRELLEANNPKVNIRVLPHDVITVPRAERIYVVGEVNKSGGFTLRERESLSVLQALALAEGLSKTAAPGSARLLRPDPKTSARVEIPVNLKSILAGKAEDIQMKSEDVLFIPNNAAKSATLRGIEAAIQIGTGVVIWRR